MFGGCNELLIKILSVINPNPVVIEKFRIVGTEVYLQASANQTLQQIEEAVLAQSEIAGAVERGRAAAGRGTSASSRTTVRIEVWSRDAPGKPGRRLATIAEYDPRSVQLIAQEGQPALKITPDRRSRGLIVTRTTIRPVAPKLKGLAGQRQ
jgi:hypothetical protein